MWLALWSALNLAWPSEVLLQSPGSSDIEYQAFLAAHGEVRTPIDALRSARPSAMAREALTDEFGAAQKIFLSGASLEARRALEQLWAKLPNEDWTAADRAVFFQVALRRAQLATTADIDSWLKRALMVGFDLNADPSLFPPPLLSRYKKLKAAVPRVSVTPPGLGRDWPLVLINGRLCTQEACARVPDVAEPLRVTWLSNQWQPFSATITVHQLPHQTAPRRPWVQGECREPKISATAQQFKTTRVFHSLECSESEAPTKINLQPVASSEPITMFDPPKKSRPLYKSPWLWVGVGVAVAILVASQQKRSDPAEEPSTTYGY